MDNYPEQAAPEFDEGGGVKTPFDVWWARAKQHFPNVPEQVAEYWLHEHWGHSPFEWLPSLKYRFKLVSWLASDLSKIRSCWCDFDETNAKCRAHGKHLIETASQLGYRTAKYMKEKRDFPIPIIVLDNLDGHLSREDYAPSGEDFPSAYLLIEGHRRFNMALHLLGLGAFSDNATVWLMTRVAD